MAVRLFSEKTLEELNDNKFVSSATSKRITYTEDFKQYFIEKYQLGFTPREIFKLAGFDVNALGYKRIERAAARWLSAENITLHRDVHAVERSMENQIARQKKEIERLNSELMAMKSQA